VWGWNSLPKVRSWSPPGLPKTQSSIAGVKISLNWNVLDVIGKALEVQMSKMSSHESFGHLQPKLWAKEGLGVKLAVWESWEKVPFGCSLAGELQRILHGGRWWLPSSPGRGESSESKLPVPCSNTKGVSKCELTLLWLVLDVGSCKNIIIPLPSLSRNF
jgi:hypothetical protein